MADTLLDWHVELDPASGVAAIMVHRPCLRRGEHRTSAAEATQRGRCAGCGDRVPEEILFQLELCAVGAAGKLGL